MAPTKLQSNHRNAQQEIIFHHPAIVPETTRWWQKSPSVLPTVGISCISAQVRHNREMTVDTGVILCGGRGSRFVASVRAELAAIERRHKWAELGPSLSTLSPEFIRDIEHTPKCLLPIKGEPLIAHKMRQLKDAGITRFALCAGRNAAATLECIRTHHLDREFDITVTGRSLFHSDDLSYIARAAKQFESPQHLVVTAGDCLTTSRYADLIAHHLTHNRPLTIATTDRNDDHVFVQDCVTSLQFIKDSCSHSSRAQREFPRCSPFVAAVQYAWHQHTLYDHHDNVHYVNINKLSDFERVIAMQDTLLPDAPYPRLSLVEYACNPQPRSQQRPLEP